MSSFVPKSSGKSSVSDTRFTQSPDETTGQDDLRCKTTDVARESLDKVQSGVGKADQAQVSLGQRANVDYGNVRKMPIRPDEKLYLQGEQSRCSRRGKRKHSW